jgi:hypothetical protein
MPISRRQLLCGALSAATVSTIVVDAASPSSGQSTRNLKDELAARAKESRLRVEFDGRTFSGPGWARIANEGAAAQFFLLGEEHGVAQIPMLARQLLLELKSSGYERLALEISDPVAAELDKAALHGIEGIRRFIAEFPPGPAFYNMKEEVEFLAATRSRFPKDVPPIWGLDYEVIQDRRLIARLQANAPAAARAAVQELDEASAALWKRFAATRNPQFIFSFAGDAKLITKIRSCWRQPDPQSAVILDILQGTLETNALWAKGKGWESNARRTKLMRGTFVRYWNAEKETGRAPKTLFKFGASHMVRGRDMTEVYDLGDLAAEAATLERSTSFHLFVGPPRSAQHAKFNPSTMGVMPVPATYFEEGVGFLADVAFPDAFTLLDLCALRPFLGYRTQTFDPRATRVIHGFDAMLVLPNATPAVML